MCPASSRLGTMRVGGFMDVRGQNSHCDWISQPMQRLRGAFLQFGPSTKHFLSATWLPQPSMKRDEWTGLQR